MISRKEILVTTTAVDSAQIRQYLHPISAHVVAGTNLFSDLRASFTDFFGGRSNSYKKQLSNIYDEAIDSLRHTASEIGANCIMGLKIDIDEVSGKGKAMFMITAVGTAVVLKDERPANTLAAVPDMQRSETVSAEKLNAFRYRKQVMTEAKSGQFSLDEETWHFITLYKMHEVAPHVLAQYRAIVLPQNETPDPQKAAEATERLTEYLHGIAEEHRNDILYNAVLNEKNPTILSRLWMVFAELYTVDFSRISVILKNAPLDQKKRALHMLNYDKPGYNKADVEELRRLKEIVENSFNETGQRISKKQLLSTKEKDMWNCECGKTNDLGYYCKGCGKDIYGFSNEDFSPSKAVSLIDEKMLLIQELLN